MVGLGLDCTNLTKHEWIYSKFGNSAQNGGSFADYYRYESYDLRSEGNPIGLGRVPVRATFSGAVLQLHWYSRQVSPFRYVPARER
jgi:hypothetical protein